MHRNHGQEHEDPVVKISSEANIEDWLKERNTEKIVEGSRGYKEIETIWSSTLENRQWKVPSQRD